MESKKFSVLMSVYFNESPDFLRQAFNSIWREQLLKPNQIVLVKDGPLTAELNEEIEKLKLELGYILCVSELKENVGLGKALSIGLDECKFDLVARMDTDDVSCPTRFQKQIELLTENPDLGLIGSNVGEFEDDFTVIRTEKKVPESHESIVKFSKTRNPFNHPSIMYKKSQVESVGGYMDCPGMEDYYLWIRMLAGNVQSYNIQENLVFMRAGVSMLSRRKGLWYAKQEVRFQLILLKMNYVSLFRAVCNITQRAPLRLLPSQLLKVVYRLLRRK